MAVRASITLRTDDLPAVGRDRIRLLEAVAREGSISRAARAVGLTYKAAWDALDMLANVLGQPLLEARAGGRAGGGAVLTPAGRAVIAAFGRVEAELERVLRELQPGLAATGLAPVDVLTGFLMRTSCRNVLRGTVTAVREDSLSAEVAVAVAPATEVHALITRDSMVSLGLCQGRAVVVLIKASFVLLAAPDAALRMSSRNRIAGTVSRCVTGDVSAEVVLDIGGGRSIAASITADAVASLGLRPGVAACALFDPGHVILAVD